MIETKTYYSRRRVPPSQRYVGLVRDLAVLLIAFSALSLLVNLSGVGNTAIATGHTMTVTQSPGIGGTTNPSGRRLHAWLPVDSITLVPELANWRHYGPMPGGHSCNATEFAPGWIIPSYVYQSPVEQTIRYNLVLTDQYDPGSKICIQAIGTGSNGGTHYRVHTISRLDPLPSNLRPVLEHDPRPSVHTDPAVLQNFANSTLTEEYQSLDGFPSRKDGQWVADYGWPGENSATYGNMPMDEQAPHILVANSDACSNPPGSGICTPDANLELLIPEGLNQPIAIWAEDLCLNAWDNYYPGGSGDIATIIEVEVQTAGNFKTIGINHTDYSTGDPRGIDCKADKDYYESKHDSGDTGYIQSPQGTSSVPSVPVSDTVIGYLEGSVNPAIADTVWHVYEQFRFNPYASGNRSPTPNVILHNVPVDRGGNTLVRETVEYRRYHLRVRVQRANGAGLPSQYHNAFRLSLQQSGREGPQPIIDYRPQPLGGSSVPAGTLGLYNGGPFSNNANVAGRYYGSWKWHYRAEVGVPCEVFNNHTLAEAWGDFYEAYNTIPSIYNGGLVPSDKINRSGWGGTGTNFSHLSDSQGEYVLAPIGLYDSDVNGGEYIPITGMSLNVWEEGDDGIWSKAENYLHQQTVNGEFTGRANTLVGASISSQNVASNDYEFFWFKFRPGKKYDIVFSDIHNRNFIQIYLPFRPTDRFAGNCDKEVTVKAIKDDDISPNSPFRDNRECDLVVTNLDWTHPDGTKPEKLSLSLGYVDPSGDWQEVTGTDYWGGTQANIPPPDTYMRWLEPPPTPLVERLLDATLPADQKIVYDQPYEVRLTGFHRTASDPLEHIDIPDSTSPNTWSSPPGILADGSGGQFRIHQDINDGKTYLQPPPYTPAVDPNTAIKCVTVDEYPKVDTALNDNCDVELTFLDWVQVPPVTPEPELQVEIGHEDTGLNWTAVKSASRDQFDRTDGAIPSDPNTGRPPPGAPRHPIPLMTWTDIDSRLQSSGPDRMVTDQEYQTRVTGYHDGGLQPFPTPPGPGPYIAPIVFQIKKVGTAVYLFDSHGDRYGPCNSTARDPQFDAVVMPACDIDITRLEWTNPNANPPDNPKLFVAIYSGSTKVYEGSVEQLPANRSYNWLGWSDIDPSTTSFQTDVEYSFRVIGYDDGNGNLINFQNGTTYVDDPPTTFYIRNHTDPVDYYYLEITDGGGNTTYAPPGGPNQPGVYCNPPTTCPPGVNCNPGAFVNCDTRMTLGAPHSIVAYGGYVLPDLEAEVYRDWVGGVARRFSHLTTSTNPADFAAFPKYYIYDDIHHPGELIPDSRTPQHPGEIVGWPGRFDHIFSDNKRDSVVQFYGLDYRPTTVINYNKPPSSVTGVGTIGSGWFDSWRYGLQIYQMRMMTGPVDLTPIVDPQWTGSQRQTFTTTSDLSYENTQVDRLVPYEWIFEYSVEGTHTHKWQHEQGDGRPTHADYLQNEWNSVKYFRDELIIPLQPIYDNNGVFIGNATRQVPYYVDEDFKSTFHNHILIGTEPSPASNTPGYNSESYHQRDVEWKWDHSTPIPSQGSMEDTQVDGRVGNCSWVLIIKRPECEVRRKIVPQGPGIDRRLNPGGVEYEIFPAGKPNDFTLMYPNNENKFPLEPEIKFRIDPRPSHAWTPRRHSADGRSLYSVGRHETTLTNPHLIGPRGSDTSYMEEPTNLEWPGEYRVTWYLEWESLANGYWPNTFDNVSGRDLRQSWAGSELNGNLWCAPPGGIEVFVSAKPPVCRVEYTMYEFSDLETRLRISLTNNLNNYVDLVIPESNPPLPASANRAYHARKLGTSVVVREGLAVLDERPSPNKPPYWDLLKAVNGQLTPIDLVSDDRLALPPPGIRPGKYDYDWTIRARRGIEWWSTQDGQKEPGAWWDNPQEKIETGAFGDCKEILRIVRIPFFKAFVGGLSAGGRFGIGEEFDSCGSEGQPRTWIDQRPVTPQGVWGHSANTDSLSTAVGSSVSNSLRAQNLVGGVYSSSHTDQDPGSTPPPKSLTYANDDSSLDFGGHFSDGSKWRCIPNYWRQPTKDAHGNDITPDTTSTTLGAGANLGDGDVKIYQPAAGLLTIDGDFRDPGDEEIRTTIYVDGDLRIDSNIINMAATPATYHGFSDMGLIQIIARGNILIDPDVTRIDAMLVAYPESDGSKGAIDLCASGTSAALAHYTDCGGLTDDNAKQLQIYGTLVAQRIYFNRITNTLNIEPYPKATSSNTVASEVIISSPAYQVATPAASVFEDWAKHPEAVFDIPTSL